VGHWDTCHPSTSNNLFFSTFLLPHSGARKVWRQSLMSNVFRILHTAVIKISLFFILLKKMKKVYHIFCNSIYLTPFCYFRVWIVLFRCHFVPLLAPNPGDATAKPTPIPLTLLTLLTQLNVLTLMYLATYIGGHLCSSRLWFVCQFSFHNIKKRNHEMSIMADIFMHWRFSLLFSPHLKCFCFIL